jgi:DNA-directed RNA polymerase subunit RPC12/RpoP
MNDKKQPQIVTYYCQECQEPFPAPQGSRQRFCDTCLNKKVRQGRPRKDKTVPALDDSRLEEIKKLLTDPQK